MSCRLCGADELSQFTGELAIHFPGLRNLDKPIVYAFPNIRVCLNCGNAEFSIPEPELFVLAIGSFAADHSISASPVATK